MGIPSLKDARVMARTKQVTEYTIGCYACRKPLWKVKLKENYGTRHAADKTPFEGVPAYEDMWTKDQQPVDTKCPFCRRNYFRVTKLPNDKLMCVPFVFEFEGH